jgi:hypothetical protein
VKLSLWARFFSDAPRRMGWQGTSSCIGPEISYRTSGPCTTDPVLGLVQDGFVAQAITRAGRVVRRGHSSRPGNRSGGTLKGGGGRDTIKRRSDSPPEREGFFVVDQGCSSSVMSTPKACANRSRPLMEMLVTQRSSCET